MRFTGKIVRADGWTRDVTGELSEANGTGYLDPAGEENAPPPEAEYRLTLDDGHSLDIVVTDSPRPRPDGRGWFAHFEFTGRLQ